MIDDDLSWKTVPSSDITKVQDGLSMHSRPTGRGPPASPASRRSTAARPLHSDSITWADIPCRCHLCLLCRPAPGPPAGRRCRPWARSGRRWRVRCPAAARGGAPAARPPCWCRIPPTPARTGCLPSAPRQTHCSYY